MFNTTSSTTGRLALGLILTGALALPGVAQADTTAHVSAAAKASARAELDLKRASRLADHTSATAKARAATLISRSRANLKTAVASARKLAAKAESPVEVRAAGRVATQVSATLIRDASLQSEIAVEAGGRLESQAAKSLIADVRMQQAVITSMLRLAAKHADERAQVVLQASRDAVDALSAEVEIAARAATSAELGAHSQASADIAVAVGTDAVGKSVSAVQAIEARVEGTVKDAAQDVRERLSTLAGQIAATVQDTQIESHDVTLNGHGLITLGALAELGVRLTASGSVSGSAAAGETSAQASGGLTGLLGIKR